jgi:ABC-type transport system involved in cytochrome bd biosynthesis fused ATPase/permease subunit
MNKIKREAIHYAILVLIITATVFLAHHFSGFLENMLTSTLQPLVSLGWILLFIWYAIFIAIIFIPCDLLLHKLLRI